MEKQRKQKKHSYLQRVLSLLLAVAMAVTILPVTAKAEETDTYEFEDHCKDSDKCVVYNGKPQSFSDAMSNIIVIHNGKELSLWHYSVSYNPSMTITWQKKEQGGYTDLPEGELPLDAGEYRLFVKEAEKIGGGEHTYDFKIMPARLDATMSLNEVPANSTKEELTPKSLIKQLYFTNGTDEKNEKDHVYFTSDLSAMEEAVPSLVNIGIVRIRNVVTNEEMKSDEHFRNDQDYVIDFELQFADQVSDRFRNNYILPETISKVVPMSELLETELVIELQKEPEEEEAQADFTYIYTGMPIEAPKEGEAYTAKVRYKAGVDEEGNTVYKELENAELAGQWYKVENKVKTALDALPTDAGEYYYSLTYAGEKGLYEAAENGFTVEIKQAVISVEPYIKEGAKFYDGMLVRDVLLQTDYCVRQADGSILEIDRSYFWGTNNNVNQQETRKQPYQPFFRLQVKNTVERENEDGTVETVEEYQDLDYGDSDVLEEGKTYRLIFTGLKVAYRASGFFYWTNINSSRESMDTNYTVDISEEALERSAKPIVLSEGKAATIQKDSILQDGKGESYENPITKVYDNKGIYDKRSEYKLAAVMPGDGTQPLAEKTDRSITYTWYRQNGEKTTVDETGNMASEPVWVTVDYDKSALGELVSPKNAGVYKLEISYKDSGNVYHALPEAVYYKIEPQKVKVVYTGETAVFAGTAAKRLLETAAVCHELEIMTENEGLNEKADWEYGEDYRLVFRVQQFNEEINAWEYFSGAKMFEKGTRYRLAVEAFELKDAGLKNNYNTYEMTEGENPEKQYFYEETEITVKDMGTQSIRIVVKEETSGTREKVYDGEAFDLSGELSDGLVTFVKAEDAKDTPLTDVAAEYLWYDQTEEEWVTEPVNAGRYSLYVSFSGSEAYAPLTSVQLEGKSVVPTGIEITIKKRELELIPSVKEKIIAGTRYDGVLELSGVVFGGMTEADKEAFTYKEKGFEAADIKTTVTDENGMMCNEYYLKYLKGDADYTLTAEAELRAPYNRNYNCQAGDLLFSVVRGNSTVAELGTLISGIPYVRFTDSVEGMTHTLVPKEGIPYSYNVRVSASEGDTDGNYVGIRIELPKEYQSLAKTDAAYKNSIEAAGGQIMSSSSDKRIDIVFEVLDREKKEFDIYWEEGYTEHFIIDFTNAEICRDLREAVSPQAISFLSPEKKMAVGETQQLNVKLKKTVQKDLIHLSYEVDQKDVLYVDENGNVTALSEGSATVKVYSSKLKDGEYVPTSPAKQAVVTIKVSAVEAPKIKKLDNITDTGATVWYPKVANGYMRAVYVLEGKNRTVEEFEAAIASMRNGIWKGIFPIQPIDCFQEEYSEEAKLNYVNLKGLKAETDYTVYVRNMNRVRSMEKGVRVTYSHNGTVKSFQTTKSQVLELELHFPEEKVLYDEEQGIYTVPLQAGKTNVSVAGKFYEWAENTAADDNDYLWYGLPLTKVQKTNYTDPKREYAVGILQTKYTGEEGLLGEYGKYYLYQTSYASISKKGQLKFTGVGIVDVVVRDKNTGVWTSEKLSITASADSISGKTVTLKPGQSIPLSELLTYKEGKKVLLGSFECAPMLDKESEKALTDSGYFEINGNFITALKEGGNLSLILYDTKLGREKKATVRLKSVKLDPVKNLKVTRTADQFFSIEFLHAGEPEGFQITITDAKKSVIKDVYRPKEELYNEDTGKYEYTVLGLAKKSKYNITVTAVYGTAQSKAVKKSVTTTLLPASYLRLEETDINTGISVYVYGKENVKLQNISFVAGNTYTLETGGSQLNKGAKVAMTDTLIWSSSDKKVAAIKPNKGSFSATLTAIHSGTSTIEVRSRITKAVIARYEITVKAVGNAYDNYYGENEALVTELTYVPAYVVKRAVEMMRQK